jgi:ATP-dependent Clp protease ATP-binding subunit ClpA
MFDRFTDAARVVMGLSRQEAQRFNHQYIGTEHILLGLLLEGRSAAADTLRGLGAGLEAVRAQVDAIVQAGPQVSSFGQLPFTPRAKATLERAVAAAEACGEIGPEQLLLGLLEVTEGVAYQALRNLGLEPAQVRAAVLDRAPLQEASAPEGPPPALTPRAARTLALAREEAEQLGRERVGTEHLFLALLQQRDAPPVTVLQKLGVDVDAVREALLALVRDD